MMARRLLKDRPMLPSLFRRAPSALILSLLMASGAACGGPEGELPDAPASWADDTASQSAALTADASWTTSGHHAGYAAASDDRGTSGTVTLIEAVAPPVSGVVAGSSPDPIPARDVARGHPVRTWPVFQSPECEPFPAGIWRDTCNLSKSRGLR